MPGQTTWAPLTAEQLEARRVVHVNSEIVTHTSATDFPGHHGPLQDDTWNLEAFRRKLRVTFHHNQAYDAAFSLVSVDASIANAFRRILLAEIPTLAIEDVFVRRNTSIVQDEVLAHRLGLIPLTGGQEGLKWLQGFRKEPPEDDFAARATWDKDGEGKSVASDDNTVVLKMDVECRWKDEGKQLAKDGSTDPNEKYVNSNVYAKQLVFEPIGRQDQYFSGADAIRPVNPDILIAKLRPGQRISVECFCVKGIGSDHAKFSPVATASYRLLPSISITQSILGADAKKFAKCFPKGVIELEVDAESGREKAVVKNPMKDTVSRECLRHEEFQGKVKLGRIRDHFIFLVESTGQFESDELFLASVRLLKAKVERFKRHLTEVEEGR